MIGPGAGRRATLLEFLTAQRRSAHAIVDGVSDTDARRSAVPSGWTLGLTVHLAGVERHWFALAAPHPEGDAGDAPRPPGADRAIRPPAHGLRPRRPTGRGPGRAARGERAVRDVVLHVIEEVARHAGHLDVARELTGGRTGLGPP